MRSLRPFSSVAGRNSVTLFEIRLDNDFIVLRGSEHESAGQVLKGVVVLCLSAPLKLDDIHLRLTGTLRLSWIDAKMTATGVSNQKVDKTARILNHLWEPFVGGAGKSVTLPAGNYEWPFEYTLPGDAAESVEGIPEASVTYRLKATVTRQKLKYNLHAHKHLRVIRTLEPAALEYLHAMSVENIWPNKVDYSIVIPQKAVVFGASVSLVMRFTPLLKGLEMGVVSAKLVEIRECIVQAAGGTNKLREHRAEREAATWKFNITRQHHWRDTIEDTGQEGWVVEKKLHLPKSMRQCVQDMNQHGIKVRHKIKLTVTLKNPDGHVSELRATLPVSIFISPNMPLDEEGNLVDQRPDAVAPEADLGTIAPPGYGEHVLDQLFDNLDMNGLQTPGLRSGTSSPYYEGSRSDSAEDLQEGESSPRPFTPGALSSRLQSIRLGSSHRNSSVISFGSAAGQAGPSSPLSRSTSDEEPVSGRSSPEHIDYSELSELNKVPSYATAVRTPARSRTYSGGVALPDYQTALDSAPGSPRNSLLADSLFTIPETNARPTSMFIPQQPQSRPQTSSRSRPLSMSSMWLQRLSMSEADGRGRLHFLQPRERIQCH